MNDHEMLVAQHIQELEKLLQESLPWQAEMEKQPDKEAHNRWADERQARFQQHLQAARAGLLVRNTLVSRPEKKKLPVEAWTPEAVSGNVDYVLETDHARSRVSPVFASQACERLSELEPAWDAQMEVLYRLSRR